MISTTLRQQQLQYQPQIWKVEMSNPRVSPHAEARWSETAVFDDSHRHVQHRRVMATFLFCSRDAAVIFCPCRCGDVSACGRGQSHVLDCFSSSTLRRHVPRAVAADVSRLCLHVGHTDSELVGCLRRPEDPRVPSVLCPGVSKKFANFLRPTSRRFSRTSRGSLSSVTPPRGRVDSVRLSESLIFSTATLAGPATLAGRPLQQEGHWQAGHGRTAGIMFQLSPRQAVGGVSGSTWHAAMFFNSLAVSVAIRGVSH